MSDSFYLDRLKKYHSSDRFHQSGDTYYSTWFNRTHIGLTAEIRCTEISYTEEEYKGHQLIVKKSELQWALVLDNGQSGYYGADEISMLIERGEWKTETQYSAYSWKIRDLATEPEVLKNLYQDIFISDNFTTKSQKQTTTKAKKRIDIEAKLIENKSILNELAENRISVRDTTAPYNLKVNDWVWIQAHGRRRNGVVIGTEGRRFIVGYTTPSNSETMKYKILNLSQIFVVEGDLIETQSHNFVKVGA